MDDLRDNFGTDAAHFADFGQVEDGVEYHAAEDIYKPTGTPVYAMADGKISYSGPMGGYGWLIHHRPSASQPLFLIWPPEPQQMAA